MVIESITSDSRRTTGTMRASGRNSQIQRSALEGWSAHMPVIGLLRTYTRPSGNRERLPGPAFPAGHHRGNVRVTLQSVWCGP